MTTRPLPRSTAWGFDPIAPSAAAVAPLEGFEPSSYGLEHQRSSNEQRLVDREGFEPPTFRV